MRGVQTGACEVHKSFTAENYKSGIKDMAELQSGIVLQ